MVLEKRFKVIRALNVLCRSAIPMIDLSIIQGVQTLMDKAILACTPKKL